MLRVLTRHQKENRMGEERRALSDDDAVTVADEVLANKTRSHVQAARELATTLLAWRSRLKVAVILNDNLTNVQARCTELIQQARYLERDLIGARQWADRFMREAEDFARYRSTAEAIAQRGVVDSNQARILREHVASITSVWDAMFTHARKGEPVPKALTDALGASIDAARRDAKLTELDIETNESAEQQTTS